MPVSRKVTFFSLLVSFLLTSNTNFQTDHDFEVSLFKLGNTMIYLQMSRLLYMCINKESE